MLKQLFKILGLNILIQRITIQSFFLIIFLNLLPLVGIYLLNWNPYDIIFVYYIENIILWIFAYLGSRRGRVSNLEIFERYWSTIFIVMSIVINTVLGILLLVFILKRTSFVVDSNWLSFLAFLLATILTYGYKYYIYIKRQEYLHVSKTDQMRYPMIRTIIIAFPILFGVVFYELNIYGKILVILFVFVKMKIDLDIKRYEPTHI